jgi:hypothetical protein
MKQKLILTLILSHLSLFSACAAQQNKAEPSPEKRAELLQHAQQSALALTQSLKAELVTAIKAGGPENALHICHAMAPALAAKIAKDQAVSIRRVSLKNRNPQNTPDPVEKLILEQWAQMPDKQEHQEIIQVNEKPTFLYMKALRVEKACLNCHGPQTQIKPEVLALLKQYYPNDQATGYAEGDLRGAVTVRIPLTEE